MNKRIQELAIEAAGRGLQTFATSDLDSPAKIQRFAELIVRECVALCDQAAEENRRTFYAVNQTQEVGPALVAKGSQVQAERLSRQIRQHFSVDQ